MTTWLMETDIRNPTPIDTRYKGYRFRSRLEARWAVFFDAINIEWCFEAEGYELGDLGRYLPDFWLPEANAWAEIKARPPTPKECAKAVVLEEGTRLAFRERGEYRWPCIWLLAGEPWRDTKRPAAYCVWTLPQLQLGKPDTDITFTDCLGCGLIRPRDLWWGSQMHCDECDMGDRIWQENRQELARFGWHFHEGDWVIDEGGVDPRFTLRLINAYNAARGARFEHGETP